MNKKIVFFAYGSRQMGMGHMVRIESLARAFLGRAFKVSLVIPAFAEGVGHAERFLGREAEIIPVDTGFAVSEDIPEQMPECDVVFFDCLRNPAQRLRKARARASALVVFDDDGEGILEADLAFNPLYLPKLSEKQLADKEVKLFSAPEYMPLREEFAEAHGTVRKPNDKKRLLLFQGGVDGWNGIVRILRLIDKVRKDITVVPVTGPAYAYGNELRAAIKDLEVEVDWKNEAEKVSEIMAEGDAAVSACGLSIFESLCLGLPSLALTDEAKEIETASRLEERGCLINLGLLRNLKETALAEGLSQVLDDRKKRESLGRAAAEAVDGRGAEHVAEAVIDFIKEKMSLYGAG